MTVYTADAKPIRSVLYRLPPQWKDSVRSEVEELVRAGIVVPFTSPRSSLIVPIQKSDGSMWFCIDYRNVTVPDFG